MYSLSHWDYFNLWILRPASAISFVLFFISLGWFLAWKLVLVHVPLVQEVFNLRKKPPKPNPPPRRLTKFYNSVNSRNSASESGFMWRMAVQSVFPRFDNIIYMSFRDKELNNLNCSLSWSARKMANASEISPIARSSNENKFEVYI